MKKAKSYHVGVAAEAFVAAQFARYGFDVSVQYGANQPEYDLMVSQGDLMLKISVKGSQDGGWGLTQSYKKGYSYHEAIERWLDDHGKKTVFCLVQFQNVADSEMPRMYLVAPAEIADMLKKSRSGNGETVLREYHEWKAGVAAGTIDKIPEEWVFSRLRAKEIFEKYAR